jgi:hypothetical protein
MPVLSTTGDGPGPSDSHGIHFLIRDMFGIDKGSRKILDRFL